MHVNTLFLITLNFKDLNSKLSSCRTKQLLAFLQPTSIPQDAPQSLLLTDVGVREYLDTANNLHAYFEAYPRCLPP